MSENQIEPAVIGPGKMSPAELRSYINEKAVKLVENHSEGSIEELMSNPTFLEYKAALDQIMSLENYYPNGSGVRKVNEKKKAKTRKNNKAARKQRKLNRKNGK
jgi:hypothetical protein